MGLVNRVVPVEELERETVAWCREMLALSPFALRLVKASFNAHEDGYAGIQQLAHDANLLFYGSEEAPRGARRSSRSESRTSPSSPAAHEDLGDGGAAADAAGGGGAGAGRDRGGGAVGRPPAALGGLRGGADRLDLHPDRHQPRQRLLRRQARCRHRRPAGAGAGHLGRAGDPAAGAAGDLDRLRGGGRLRHLPDRGGGHRDPPDRRALDRRRRPLHGRAAALRLRRARRGLRLPLLRPGRRQRLLLRPGRAARRAAARALDLDRLPRHRDHRRQQRPRRRDRPPGRQDDDGGADGPARRGQPLRAAGTGRLRGPADLAGGGRNRLVGADRPGRGAAGDPADPDARDPNRRPGAERGAGGDRRRPRRVQRPRLGRAADLPEAECASPRSRSSPTRSRSGSPT